LQLAKLVVGKVVELIQWPLSHVESPQPQPQPCLNSKI